MHFSFQLSDELLHRKVDVQSCYIAAQTLRTKIQYSFNELPSGDGGEAALSLKECLMQHVSNIDENTNSIIVTQLSLALVDLLLQLPDWQNAVPELLQRFGTARCENFI